ncbi:rnhA operon protein [Halobacteriales archaeon QS_8_69_26]|nr:MAG: rnhA operon protein [Halobacteriales archaeon QS_8_69_26]
MHDHEAEDAEGEELPEEVVAEAERLTRQARRAADDREREAYEADRADLLADHGFTARVRREDDGEETLVVHPEEWVDDGTIRPDRVEDVDRAVEVPLSGSGDPDEWADLDAHNREVVAEVRAAHGDVHGDNAAAFADFMGNHYAKPVEDATPAEVREFLEEYFPRNAWPDEEQRAAVGRSVRLVFEVTGEPVPEV